MSESPAEHAIGDQLRLDAAGQDEPAGPLIDYHHEPPEPLSSTSDDTDSED